MRLAKLNRSMSHRRALFRNLVSELIEHEQIKTTFPKAKAISRLAEKVITWSKYGVENVFYQRKAQSYLMNWVRVRKHLFHNLAKRYEGRCGGYTRIHRIGFRTNDHAPLAVIELVDNARDLKRDKVIRTVSRELAQLELSLKTARHVASSSSIGAKIPEAVWRNVPCASEDQAKKAIEEFQKLLPELTNKNLKKVLSESYIKSYQYCQLPQILTKEEAETEIAHERKLREDNNKVDGVFTSSPPLPATSQPSGAHTKPTPPFYRDLSPEAKHRDFAHLKGIPRPLGAYTDFLYNVRLHFHRNLALLDPTKLGGKNSISSRRNLQDSNPFDNIHESV